MCLFCWLLVVFVLALLIFGYLGLVVLGIYVFPGCFGIGWLLLVACDLEVCRLNTVCFCLLR